MLQVRSGVEPRWRRVARMLVATALIVVIAAALGACGSGSSSSGADASGGSAATIPEGRTGGTIVWSKSSEVAASDPMTNTASSAWQILNRVYENLVTLDGDLKPQPKLATAWRQTSPTTWEFTLRRGVKFSNGRELTVDDVVGSLKRLTDPKTAAPWAAQIGDVKSIKTIGDSQVEIQLAKPNAFLLPALAGPSAVILPMKELEDGSFNPRKQQLGTGPFMVASHSQDELWTLKRNPYYWGKNQPKVDALSVRIMPDDAARVAGLKDGSVDVANFDTPDAVRLLGGVPNVKTVVQQTTDYYTLNVNATTSIFKDPRLREALSLAIDRKQISDVALGGTSAPTAAVAPAFGICEPGDMPYATPDLARASKLVEAAGAKGKTVSIIAGSTYKPFAQVAQVLQQNLQQIGLKVKVEQPAQGEEFARVYLGKSDFDLAISYFGGLSDPGMVLVWWGNDQPWNKAWYPANDARLLEAIAQSRTQTDAAARKQAIKVACERISRNANMIPLVTKPAFVAYRTDKVQVPLQALDPYSDPLSRAADFSLSAR
jgi:peptide/nickel transport system substrate-binding protein